MPSTGSLVLDSLGVDRTIGAIQICAFLSCAWFGVVLTQSLSYFSRFPEDRVLFKLLVLGCLFSCVADTFLDACWSYRWTVKHYRDPAILEQAPFELGTIDAVSSVLFLAVQGFFAWRLYRISMRKWLWPAVIMLGAVTQFACILYIAPLYIKSPSWEHLETAIFPAAWVWLGSSAASEFVVTVGMIYYLHIKARGVQSSRGPFQIIVYRSIQSNVLGLISQVLGLALFRHTDTAGFWFLSTIFLQPKIISFSLIASLNSRRTSEVGHHWTPTPESPTEMSDYDSVRGRRQGVRSSFFDDGGIAPHIGIAMGRRVSVHVERETQVDIEKPEEVWKPSARQLRGPVQVVLPQEDDGRGDANPRLTSSAPNF